MSNLGSKLVGQYLQRLNHSLATDANILVCGRERGVAARSGALRLRILLS